jgi:hypothetical protein
VVGLPQERFESTQQKYFYSSGKGALKEMRFRLDTNNPRLATAQHNVLAIQPGKEVLRMKLPVKSIAIAVILVAPMSSFAQSAEPDTLTDFESKSVDSVTVRQGQLEQTSYPDRSKATDRSIARSGASEQSASPSDLRVSSYSPPVYIVR